LGKTKGRSSDALYFPRAISRQNERRENFAAMLNEHRVTRFPKNPPCPARFRHFVSGVLRL